MNTLKEVICLGLFLIVSGCNVYKDIYSDYDKRVDFSTYKSFAWLPDHDSTANTPYENDVIRSNTKNYFGHCMKEKGYVIDTLQPDVLLQLVIKNQEKTGVIPPNYATAYYYDINYYPSPSIYTYDYWDGSYLTQRVVQKFDYIEGAITLNIIDRKSKSLVWTGSAEGNIYDVSKIKNDIHPAIHKMLKDYPILVSKKNK